MRRPTFASRIVGTFVLALTVSTNAEPQTAAATVPEISAPEGPGSRRLRAMNVARGIMVAARYCTLVTIGSKGEPQARIVDPLEPGKAFDVYIATNPKSRKVAEMRRDSRVTLLYFDAAKLAYVTVVGVATEVRGSDKVAYRKPEWDAFFSKEKPAEYLLYRVAPSRLEVVSAPDGFAGDPSTWRPEIVEFK